MVSITEFDGIALGQPGAAPLIDASLNVAGALQRSIGTEGDLQVQSGVSRLAMIAAMSASTALIAMASGRCTLGPQPADISVTTDDSGNLILRCGHSPPHEWRYSTGERI